MKKGAIVGCLAVVAVLAGCSSSSTKSASSTAASSSPAAPTTAASSTAAAPSTSSAATGAAGQLPSTAKLAAIVVHRADLSAGWTSTPHQPDPDDAGNQAALLQCVGGRNTAADRVAQANSPDFSLNGAAISSSATSYKSQADIDADIAVIRSPKINSCYTKLARAQIAKSLPAGSTVNAISLKITPGAGGGPANVVGTGTGTVTVTASGKQVTVYLAIAFITGPLIEAEIDIENPSQPVPAAVFTSLTNTVAARAARS